MNKKTNNNFVLMIAIVIAVMVFAFSSVLIKFSVSEETSDIITKGLIILIGIVLYISFHFKEMKEIENAKESKSSKELIVDKFNYYSRNVKYFQKLSIIALIIFVLYQVKEMSTLESFTFNSFSFQPVATIVTLIATIIMLGELRKFFENSASVGTPFNKENSKVLNNISKLFLLLLLVNHNVLSVAIFIFVEVVSIMFKLGVELQEENDNTI